MGYLKKTSGPNELPIHSKLIDAAPEIWPPDSSIFTIHPESGKKHGQGNGVKPIKEDRPDTGARVWIGR